METLGPLGFSGKVARYFLRNTLTPLMALIALLLGVVAVLVTPREEEPQIDVTMANVFVPFPGATAKDVEALVARPAEQVLARMSGVKHIFSTSRPGMAVFAIQFEVGEDATQAIVRLYDTIHSNKDWISPELGVGEPIVKPRSIDDIPIVALTFHATDPALSAFELQQVARATETELKRLPGTRDITSSGGPGHLVRVLADAERLAAHRLTMQDLKAALQIANASQPAGKLVAGNREVLVQTGTYLTSAKDVAQLVVGVFRGKPVFMNDVAQVVEGPDEPSNAVWHIDREGEYPAVTLGVSKKPGTNAADVATAVMNRIEALKGTVIPEGVEVIPVRNYGATATEKAEQLIGKLIFATAFVVLLVLVTMGKREALIVGAAVTLTLAATLFASWAYGFTLNRVSLFALIFSIGILVDDAIVVVENIHRRHLLEPQRPLSEIIPLAVDEVGGPTILATFTVIAALMPMAFVPGLMGPYMSPIPINSSMGMAISLVIAFVITPWLALKLMKPHHAPQVPPSASNPSGFANESGPHGGRVVGAGGTAPGAHGEAQDPRIERFFRRLMTPLLDERTGQAARRKLWLGLLAGIAGSVSLAFVQLVLLKMMPFDNKSEFQVVLDMPAGTPVQETTRVLREMAEELRSVPEVTHMQLYAGAAAPITFNGLVRQYYLRAEPEMGDLQVNLVDKKHRDRQSHEIAVDVRARLEAIAAASGGNAKVVEVPPGPPVLAPIVAEIYGPDYEGQMAVAKKVREAFGQAGEIVGIDDSVEADAEKVTLRVNQVKAAQLGVAQKDIVEVVGMGLAGQNVTPVHGADAKREIPVRIALPAERHGSLDALLALKVRATMGERAGTLVPVSELVSVERSTRDKTIYRKDLLPVVYVIGDQGGRLDSPLYGMFAIRSLVNEISLDDVPRAAGKIAQTFVYPPTDPYAGYAIKWDGEWQITYETFTAMGGAYAVGLVLIYLLVVAQFRSYLVPLIIMAPIPLTIIGVMPGHALLGKHFTATSMIGMIALAGIIVRNSILLVDFINEQLAAGTEFKEAVIQAASVRAKPIVLTALAAMLGAVFILGDPIFNGLAISLIFGIFVSTLLTLLVIPVLYYAAMRQRLTERSVS